MLTWQFIFVVHGMRRRLPFNTRTFLREFTVSWRRAIEIEMHKLLLPTLFFVSKRSTQ